MNNNFLDYLSLGELSELMRQLRAEQIEFCGGSNLGLRQVINAGVKSGAISTGSLITIAESMDGIDDLFSSDAVTPLNVRKGLRTWTDAFGNVQYDQGGFNPSPDLSRADQPQFNDVTLAKRRLVEQGGVLTDAQGNAKVDIQIFDELRQMDSERISETEALFAELEPTDNAMNPSGSIAVDSEWINTIERNGDGTTSVQTYSQKGVRTYTYPDASSNIFDSMNHAHRSGTSVGGAWHKEVKGSGLDELFTTN
ncbi:conserved hypothetical protein [Vibrio chagasii]|nr:conserved hypothetical protein [Vibrio chagasii]